MTEQVLYEIHDPAAYLTPDVVLDLTEVELREIGPDRVRLHGARGRPAPETLKATVCFDGGLLGEAEISYAGPNAAARARLAIDTVRARVRAARAGARVQGRRGRRRQHPRRLGRRRARGRLARRRGRARALCRRRRMTPARSTS